MTHAAGWYPDGTGRHAQRYFDGQRWTDHVADASGRQSMDPVVAAAAPAAVTPAPTSSGWQTGSASSSFAPPSMGTTLTAPRAAGTSMAGGVTVSVGMLVAGVGAILALLSILALDYWKAGDFGLTLGDIADAPGSAGINALASSYAGFGRFLAVLAIVAVVVAVLRLPRLAAINDRLPMIATSVAGVFALWHLVGLFVAPDGAGMALTGLLGFVGLAGLAAAPFLEQPLTSAPK